MEFIVMESCWPDGRLFRFTNPKVITPDDEQLHVDDELMLEGEPTAKIVLTQSPAAIFN